MAKELFSGKLNIYYGQFYIDVLEVDENNYLTMESAFNGQNNGLCGASHKGKILFVVGLQDGVINLNVELCEEEPELDELSEDIVECSFSVKDENLHLCEWAHEETHKLDIPPGDYILRYSVIGLDKDYDDDEEWDAPIEGQKYIIQIWPGNIHEDKIVKSGTDVGKYWHKALGGGIIAHNTSLEDLQARVNDDPFMAHDVVSSEILEISPAMAEDRLQFLLG